MPAPAQAGDPDLLGRASGAPSPPSRSRIAWLAPSGTCSSCSASTVKPQRPSSAMSSPWGRWNSTEPSLHSKRRMPNCGRASASPEGSSSSCMREHDQRRVGEEPQAAARSQEARRLGDPRFGVTPQAGAVLGDREVERVVGQRHRLGTALDEREVEAVLGLQPAGGRELFRRDVDAHRSRSAARQPRRHVGRPAAQLDHVAPVDVGQRADARLGDRPVPPGDLVVGPGAAPGLGVVVGHGAPRDRDWPRA